MLTLYRRHLSSCKHGSMRRRSCTCPLWVHGKARDKFIRKSLGTRNWEVGMARLRAMELEQPEEVSLADACERFVKYGEARKLGAAQVGKYKLLKTELKEYFPGRMVGTLTLEDLSGFQESWDMSAVSVSKKLERLRSFFNFCVERDWIAKNPARLLKPPKVKQKPTLPFSSDEIEKIMWATEVYPDRPKGRRAQVKAFILLLRHSGLRIGDAIALEAKRIHDGKLLLYTAKAGTPVWLPLPENVVTSLKSVVCGDLFFWSGLGKLKSAVADWQRSLAKLFKLAGVKGHAHMFRDTLAVDLLTHGVTLENVAAILGNTLRVAEKHYSPWVKSRQVELEKAVKATW